jgi:pimeloyl-ACP methyl ester carboxylesterase
MWIVDRGLWKWWMVALAALPLWAQAPRLGKNAVTVRGQPQDLYYFPGHSDSKPPKGRILFAPGDGGWRGFAITIAQTAASWGYNVYGIDTRRYLMSFTGKTTLQETEVMGDFRQLAGWITRGAADKVTLVGWSEGAGLVLLPAASPERSKAFNGVVLVGLPESAVLGWRWIDDVTYVTKREPNEPHFFTALYLPRVAPLPLVVIQSSGDEYTSLETVKKLFAAAQEPKKFSLVPARNHRFDSNREGFFRALREGIEWIDQGGR